MKTPIKMHGIGLDSAGRCVHYHTSCDIASLLCGKCRKYYACFSCHDELEDHPFQATGSEEPYPVFCGVCRHPLTHKEYAAGACPYCGREFNPRCKVHEEIYFKK